MSQPEGFKPNPQPNRLPGQPRRLSPPIPLPYHITEPFLDRGLWSFWLAADSEVLEFVSNISCILPPPVAPFTRRMQGRILFAINPRYDHVEAWQWIRQMLEDETHRVELNDSWETAIGQAQYSAPGDDNPSPDAV